MGTFDVYCAICGGPFDSYYIVDKNAGSQDANDDAGYDPDVISEDEAGWTRTLHVIGLEEDESGELPLSARKAFVSGPGGYSGVGSVSVEAGEDAHFDPNHWMACYDNGGSGNTVFPFHWCCFEILAWFLTGVPDVSKVDRHRLCCVFYELESFGRCFELNYGLASQMQEQWWISEPGTEFLVAHPLVSPGLDAFLRATIATKDFDASTSTNDLGERVKSDPFRKLPQEIVLKILDDLAATPLLHLATASWSIHQALQNNTGFWKRRVVKELPWFRELYQLLDEPEVTKGKDAKKAFLWARRMAKPRYGLNGPLMSIANRKRIWGVCKQIAESYADVDTESRTDADGGTDDDTDDGDESEDGNEDGSEDENDTENEDI